MYDNFVRLHQALKVSAAMAAGVTDRLWEMVDVVNVLDAFEAKRKRRPKVVFNVEPWRIGEGYYVTVAMPDSESARVTETFATEDEAWRWIRNESAAWLTLLRTRSANRSGVQFKARLLKSLHQLRHCLFDVIIKWNRDDTCHIRREFDISFMKDSAVLARKRGKMALLRRPQSAPIHPIRKSKTK